MARLPASALLKAATLSTSRRAANQSFASAVVRFFFVLFVERWHSANPTNSRSDTPLHLRALLQLLRFVIESLLVLKLLSPSLIVV